MRFGVASVGWNRPEMQKYSLRFLGECRRAKDIDLFVFMDGHGMGGKKAREMIKKVRGKFASGPHLVQRDSNWGLSRNILDAINTLYEAGYEIICVMEDDVVPSKDFVEYQIYCHEHFDLEKHRIFGVSGYTKSILKHGKYSPSSAVKLQQWYTPDGISFTREQWKLVREKLELYYQNPNAAVEKLRSGIERAEPSFIKRQWSGGSYKHKRQAGFLNAIRAYYSRYTLVPCVSRCQDIGMYGFHQKQKSHKGERMADRETWSKSMWYSKCWSDDHDWDKLYLLKKTKKGLIAMNEDKTDVIIPPRRGPNIPSRQIRIRPQ